MKNVVIQYQITDRNNVNQKLYVSTQYALGNINANGVVELSKGNVAKVEGPRLQVSNEKHTLHLGYTAPGINMPVWSETEAAGMTNEQRLKDCSIRTAYWDKKLAGVKEEKDSAKVRLFHLAYDLLTGAISEDAFLKQPATPQPVPQPIVTPVVQPITSQTTAKKAEKKAKAQNLLDGTTDWDEITANRPRPDYIDGLLDEADKLLKEQGERLKALRTAAQEYTKYYAATRRSSLKTDDLKLTFETLAIYIMSAQPDEISEYVIYRNTHPQATLDDLIKEFNIDAEEVEKFLNAGMSAPTPAPAPTGTP